MESFTLKYKSQRESQVDEVCFLCGCQKVNNAPIFGETNPSLFTHSFDARLRQHVEASFVFVGTYPSFTCDWYVFHAFPFHIIDTMTTVVNGKFHL